MTHTYAYDVVGRQTADAITTVGTNVSATVRRIESAYDVLGRVTGVTSFNAPASGTAVNQVTRGYNGFGQLTNEWQSHTGLVDPATTPRVQYAYSQGSGGNHSRLTRVTYPDGYTLNYTYSGIDSAVSRPTSLSGLRAGSTSSITLEAFKYLGAGTVIERSRPEVNITLSMVNFSGATGDAGDKYTGLDRFGRVVDQRWTKGTTATSAVMDRYGYTYDRNSTRLTRSNALAAAFSETYAYDALNQLQSFNRTGGTTTSQQWQFDALGNWTTVTTNGVAENRTANAQNELTQVGGSSLAYSRTGNLTTDAQGRTLSYDAWNRLVSAKNAAGAEVARYGYDGLNRRIVEQAGTPAYPAAASAPIRDIYFSQDWQALEERLRTTPSEIGTTADTRFIWSPVYVDAMIARDRNADANSTTGTGGLEQRVYVLQDANWNTTAIIAATGVPGVTAGNVITRFAYTPYGESQTLTASWATPPAGSTPAVPWAHLFQGVEFTDVTGLAYVRHRDYSATLGRFIELDPIGFSAGDSNWYRFVANGPTGKVDPSGLQIIVSGGSSIPTVIPPNGAPDVPKPHSPFDDLAQRLSGLASTQKCRDEAVRIAAAIRNTFDNNWTWSFPKWGEDHRVKGYYCYDWAYGFEDAVSHESSGACFTVKVEASWKMGTELVHFWIRISSVENPGRSIFVDDGFTGDGYVHDKPPRGELPWTAGTPADKPRNECSPVPACDCKGNRVPR